MPMVDNDMCSLIKGDAGENRICAGGNIGEGVCDVSTFDLFSLCETVIDTDIPLFSVFIKV